MSDIDKNNDYLMMVLSTDTGKAMFLDSSGKVADEATDGKDMRINYLSPHNEVVVYIVLSTEELIVLDLMVEILSLRTLI